MVIAKVPSMPSSAREMTRNNALQLLSILNRNAAPIRMAVNERKFGEILAATNGRVSQ